MHVLFLYIVPLQTSKSTIDPGAIQKAADFVRAFMLGFDVEVH
jgi:rRNA processing protein Krr1/Pno1